MNMEVSRVTSKGQITIPKAIRIRLNLTKGDKVAFIEEESGKIFITKSSVVALREFLDSMTEIQTKGIAEEEPVERPRTGPGGNVE